MTTKTKPHIARRILAGLIDYILIYIFTLIMIFSFGEQNSDGEYVLTGFMALLPISFWLLLTVGFETSLGYTLGNGIVGLNPIPKNGQNRKLTFWESLKRHLLDPIDMFFFGLIGIVTIKNTEQNQRLGDIWANTIVVKNNS